MNIAFVVALACAVADGYAVARQNKTLEYVFKPATLLVLILATVLLLSSPHDAWQAPWFLVGLFFSLLGDIFLVLPNKRWFIAGLGSFLVAHIAYVVGLNPTLPPLAAILVFIPCALVVGAVVRRVIAALRTSASLGARNHSSLLLPVIAYGVAMTLMVFSAYATLLRPEWTNPRRILVITGATLFFISDSILAWNRFVNEFPSARLLVMVTYHIGQILLALSIAT